MLFPAVRKVLSVIRHAMLKLFRSNPWTITWITCFVLWGGLFPSDRAAQPRLAIFTDILIVVDIAMMFASGVAWIVSLRRRSAG